MRRDPGPVIAPGLTERGCAVVADAGAASFTASLTRPEDLLALSFDFFNLQLETAAAEVRHNVPERLGSAAVADEDRVADG